MSYRVKITLNHVAREEAMATMRMRGMEVPNAFEGPVFENVRDSVVDVGFFSLELEDGTMYGYPVSSIARLARYPKAE